MNSVFFRRVFSGYLKNKKKAIICMIICTVISGMTGIWQVLNLKNSQSVQTQQYEVQLEQYQSRLETYDASIQEVEEAIAVARQQISMVQEYCDNSVYMKLNSQEIEVADIQYVVRQTEVSGHILNALLLYINDGGLKAEISPLVEGVKEEYLDEIISCNINGNSINVLILHYDAEMVKQIMQVMEQKLIEYSEKLKEIHGDFSFEKSDESYYEKADVTVLNAQNTQLSNLKNYQSNLSDLLKKKAEQEKIRDAYANENLPETMKKKNSAVVLLTFLCVGLFIGTAIPGIVFCFILIVDDRLLQPEELRFLGIPVLDCFSYSSEDLKKAEDCVEKMLLWARANATTEICICSLSKDRDINEFMAECAEKLRKEGIQLICVTDAVNNIEDLKRMIRIGNSILVIRLGETACTQIEDIAELYQKYNIEKKSLIAIQ